MRTKKQTNLLFQEDQQMKQLGVCVLSQIPRWDSNSGPPDQKSGFQPLKPEKHAQLAEASCNTQSSGTPLLHMYYKRILKQNYMVKHYLY